jgi:PHD/YefM family antitoxin component YafN of YafNO toxin-antitoxin module
MGPDILSRAYVDRVDEDHAHVVVISPNSEANIEVPKESLSECGALYAGALLGIVLTGEDTFKFIHLEEEEKERRESAPKPDLSFLDN